MNDSNSDKETPPTPEKRPDKPDEKLLYALKFGLSRKKARDWAGMNKDDVREKRDANPAFASAMQAAMAEGDLYLLEKCFRDSHWQAWRLILEYRAGLGKKRLVSTESEPPAPRDPPANDPVAAHLANELASIPPGMELHARIVIDEPAEAEAQSSNVTHVEETQTLKT